MSTVAVTGVANAYGAAVAARLDGAEGIDALVGLDVTAPDMPAPGLEFRTVDVRDRLLAVALEDVDVLVHCAFDTDVARSEDTLFAHNVGGLRNLLAAADQVGVRKLVVLSSTMAYGAHPDNPVPLDEDDPLRASPDLAYAYQRMLCDELVREWAEEHPQVVVTVLRTAVTLGPGMVHLAVRTLQAPRVVTVRGSSPLWQFVHLDDVADAALLAVRDDLPGAYNVAADGWLAADEVATILGRRVQVVPEAAATEALRLLWEWGIGHAPPGVLQYLIHPWVVDTARLRGAGWAPRYGQRETLRAFADVYGHEIAFGRYALPRRDVYGAAGAAGGATAMCLLLLLRWWRRRRARHTAPTTARDVA